MTDDTQTVISAVSFATTPLLEISSRVRGIVELGWVENEGDRGDPWTAVFEKEFPFGERNPEAELRTAMGDYWLDAAAIAALDSK